MPSRLAASRVHPCARSIVDQSTALDGRDGRDVCVGRATLAARATRAIMRLKDQERVVLSLYYFEELKLHEIATVLELTESRVSQIRSKALGKLRGELRPLREQVA